MYISAVNTAVPPNRYSKAECLHAFEASQQFKQFTGRAQTIIRHVLTSDNGLEFRHLALDSIADAFVIDPNVLSARFAKHAPALAAEAGTGALAASGLATDQIDAVVVSTCTGYLCPGLSSYMVELLGLRPDVQAYDLVGQGCAAALPNLHLSKSLLDSGSCHHVLSICVEICSAAMYLDEDAGVLISACLFGDGAGAAILSKQALANTSSNRRLQWQDFETIVNPTHRGALRFEHSNGMLRNVLTRQVPKLAADHAYQILSTVLQRNQLAQHDLQGWIMHAGGRDVLVALEKKFMLDKDSLRFSAAVLRNYGNMSSAFLYFVLQAALAANVSGGYWWLSSFGAGFTCHGALLKVD